VRLDHDGFACFRGAQEEIAELTLEAGVEVDFGLLEEEPGVGGVFKACDEDGKELAYSKADLREINGFSRDCTRLDRSGVSDGFEWVDG
jgi:hypothetical protein